MPLNVHTYLSCEQSERLQWLFHGDNIMNIVLVIIIISIINRHSKGF